MWAAWTSVYLVLALGLHILLSRCWRRGGTFAAFLLAGSIGGMALAGHLILRGELGAIAVASVLAYGLACELYIFLFSMVSSSISVSIVLSLADRPASIEELDARYSGEGMIRRRLEKLAASGLLMRTGNGYRTTGAGIRLSRVFRRLRLFFGHDSPSAAGQGRADAP